MSGSSKRKRAKRAARAANAANEAERSRIQLEMEALQRGMGEQTAGKRRARIGRSGASAMGGLLSSASAGITGAGDETLG